MSEPEKNADKAPKRTQFDKLLHRRGDLIKATKAGLTEVDGAAVIPVEVFNQNLPEGHTPESVNELNEYLTDYSAASVLAIGDHAADKFSNGKKSPATYGGHAKTGFGPVRATFTREKEYTVAGNTSITKGGSVVACEFTAGQTGSGAMHAVREHIKKICADKY